MVVFVPIDIEEAASVFFDSSFTTDIVENDNLSSHWDKFVPTDDLLNLEDDTIDSEPPTPRHGTLRTTLNFSATPLLTMKTQSIDELWRPAFETPNSNNTHNNSLIPELQFKSPDILEGSQLKYMERFNNSNESDTLNTTNNPSQLRLDDAFVHDLNPEEIFGSHSQICPKSQSFTMRSSQFVAAAQKLALNDSDDLIGHILTPDKVLRESLIFQEAVRSTQELLDENLVDDLEGQERLDFDMMDPFSSDFVVDEDFSTAHQMSGVSMANFSQSALLESCANLASPSKEPLFNFNGHDDFQSILNPSQDQYLLKDTNLPGFTLASGKVIAISTEVIESNRRTIFADLNHDLPESDISSKSKPNNAQFSGFSTAPGKSIKVYEESLQNASKLLELKEPSFCGQELDFSLKGIKGFTTASGKDISLSSESLSMENNDDSSKISGFSTASGKSIFTSEQYLRQAEKLLEEVNQPSVEQSKFNEINGTLKQIKENRMNQLSIGFSSANGKSIPKPSAQSLSKAAILCDDGNTTIRKTLSPLNPFKVSKEKEKTLQSKSTIATKRNSSGVFMHSSPITKSPTINGFSAQKKLRASFSEGLVEIPRHSPLKIQTPILFNLQKSTDRKSLSSLKPSLHVSTEEYRFMNISEDICTMSFHSAKNPIRLSPCWGAEEAHQELHKLGGILVNLEWVNNHYRQIVLKTCSMIRMFPFELDVRFFSPETIMLQLCYRYEREINSCQRPVLKKIAERDVSSNGSFIFYVADIGKPSMQSEEYSLQKSPTSLNIKLAKEDTRFEILLSDGWYSIWTKVDHEIGNLLSSGQIFIGQKIQVFNPQLNSGEACDILCCIEKQVKLKICINSIRRARWFCKLGRQRIHGFLQPISHIRPLGGMVPAIKVIVTRIYPPIYLISGLPGEERPLLKTEREFQSLMEQEMQHFDAEARTNMTITRTIPCQILDSCRIERLSVGYLSIRNVNEEIFSKLSEGVGLEVFMTQPIASKSLKDRIHLETVKSSIISIFTANEKLHEKFSRKWLQSNDLVTLQVDDEVDICGTIIEVCDRFVWLLLNDSATDEHNLISIEFSHRFRSQINSFKPGSFMGCRDLTFIYRDPRHGFGVFLVTDHTDYIKKFSSDSLQILSKASHELIAQMRDHLMKTILSSV